MTEPWALALKERLTDADAPPGDLAQVVRRGRRIRRRRQARASVGVLGALALVWAGATTLAGDIRERAVEDDYAGVGPLDLSHGLRAYADPGVEIHLGGRTFDARRLDYLDTDAIATSSGVVFYDAGRPMLLGADGSVEALVDGAVDVAPDFHPTAKADSRTDEVAFGVRRDGKAEITVRDLGTGEDVYSYSLDCGACTGVVIDAYDDRVLYLRTGGSTVAVLVDSDEVVDLGPDVRIADARNDVVLYDGARPTPDPAGRRDWTFVPAAIDSQLTFDGAHVLAWSSRLEPIDPEGEPIVLGAGPTDGSLGFWTIDTDGSVLVAAPDGRYPSYLVQDCEVPSGTCSPVGPLKPTGGDPEFIGDDM